MNLPGYFVIAALVLIISDCAIGGSDTALFDWGFLVVPRQGDC
ncbi:MAG: hypothetical protein OQL18_04210 [Deltaproteobacteria bacterium]|nr:hypothetical protein [Deltaproteobacteria bacterium]